MLYWYRLIRDLPVPQPRTEMVAISSDSISSAINVGRGLCGSDMERLCAAMSRIGRFPMFLRTDTSSQKRHFRRTCRLPDERSLLGHILELASLNAAAGLHDRGIAFREWIDIDANFTAFASLPIGCEARAVIRGGEVAGVRPYWTEDVIAGWDGLPDSEIRKGWRSILARQNETVHGSADEIRRHAGEVAGVVRGEWSVDFARGRDGTWYLIDMEAAADCRAVRPEGHA